MAKAHYVVVVQGHFAFFGEYGDALSFANACDFCNPWVGNMWGLLQR